MYIKLKRDNGCHVVWCISHDASMLSSPQHRDLKPTCMDRSRAPQCKNTQPNTHTHTHIHRCKRKPRNPRISPPKSPAKWHLHQPALTLMPEHCSVMKLNLGCSQKDIKKILWFLKKKCFSFSDMNIFCLSLVLYDRQTLGCEFVLFYDILWTKQLINEFRKGLTDSRINNEKNVWPYVSIAHLSYCNSTVDQWTCPSYKTHGVISWPWCIMLFTCQTHLSLASHLWTQPTVFVVAGTNNSSMFHLWKIHLL